MRIDNGIALTATEGDIEALSTSEKIDINMAIAST